MIGQMVAMISQMSIQMAIMHSPPLPYLLVERERRLDFAFVSAYEE
jgi:hypothetical protein